MNRSLGLGILFIVGFSTILLGCKKEERTSDTASTTAPVHSTVVDSRWVMKAGEWEITGTHAFGGQTIVAPRHVVCENEPVTMERIVTQFDDGSGGCQITQFQSLEDKQLFSIHCARSNSTREVVVSDWTNTGFKQASVMTTQRSNGEVYEETSKLEFKYLGPCEGQENVK